MNSVAGAMAKAFPVSYAGNYFLARAYDVPRGSTTAQRNIMWEDQQRGTYTFPETPDNNY